MGLVSTFENGPRKTIIRKGDYNFIVEYYLDGRLIGTTSHGDEGAAEQIADDFVLIPGSEKTFLTE